jgi:hypothetical protein
MRSGMVSFGVVLLVVGGILYFLPLITAALGLGTFAIPAGITYAVLGLGLIFLVLGLILPADREDVIVRHTSEAPARRVVRTETVEEEVDERRL